MDQYSFQSWIIGMLNTSTSSLIHGLICYGLLGMNNAWTLNVIHVEYHSIHSNNILLS